MDVSIRIKNNKNYAPLTIYDLIGPVRMKPSTLLLTLCLLLAATEDSRAQPVGDVVVAWGDNTFGQTNVPAGLSGVAAIAAGGYHTLALKTNGTVAAWGASGSFDFGQTDVPSGLIGVTAIAGGGFHNVALQSDGTVLAWGRNDLGQTNVPAGLSGVVAIAAGGAHTVTLKTNGTVVAWGYNGYGQATVPAGLSGVTAVAAAGSHTVILKTNGTVVAWGYNISNQTNVPAGLSGVMAIAAGGSHTVALKTNGTVVAWGDNAYGQRTVPAGLSGVSAIAAGSYHTVAMRTNGTMVVWGANGGFNYGQTNAPVGLHGVVCIAAGAYHTVALGLLTPSITSQPTSVTVNVSSNAAFNIIATSTSPLSYQWLKDGGSLDGETNANLLISNVQTNQAGNYAVIITNSYGSVTSSVAVLTVNRLAQTVSFGPLQGKLSATASSGLPVNYTNSNPGVATVSGNTVTMTGIGSTTITASQPGNATYLPAGAVSRTLNVAPLGIGIQPVSVTVNVSSNATFSVTTLGVDPFSYQWRKAGVDVIEATNATLTLSNVQTNQAGNYTVVITNVWGSVTSSVAALTVNRLNQAINFGLLPGKRLDDAPFTLSATTSSSLPASYTSANPDVATVSGNTVTITGTGNTIITANQPGNATYLPAATVNQTLRVAKLLGAVVAWGYNFSGQTNVPAGLLGVTAIAAGFSHTAALQINGTVVAWGDNGYRQTNVPAGLSGVATIAAGGYHTVALKTNGALVAWGSNGYGQTNVPAGLSGVAAVAAGIYHTVALKTNGTVVAWGDNSLGQTNVLPSGLSGVTAIAAGLNHTVALQSDGTVVAWGNNSSGQTTVPPGLHDVVGIAAGGDHTVALKSDGTVLAWGNSAFGQTNVPADLSGVTAVAGGGYHTVALKTNGNLVAWGNNGDGQTNTPAGLIGVMAIAAGGYHTVALAPAVGPSITEQPASLTVNATSDAALSVTATGTAPLIYQWVKDGVDVFGGSGSTLTFIAPNRSRAGTYSVRVSNSAGSVTSSNATLRVLVPQRMESPVWLGDGRVRLTFRDDSGSGVPEDLGKLILISTDALNGTNTVWITNTTTTGFTINNGYLVAEDVGATNAAQRFYRIIEW